MRDRGGLHCNLAAAEKLGVRLLVSLHASISTTSSSPRVWLLTEALALACVLLVRSAAEVPLHSSGAVFGCNPIIDKKCRPDSLVGELLPGSGIDMDGDEADEDELPPAGIRPTPLHDPWPCLNRV